jgi:hypothetical protein
MPIMGKKPPLVCVVVVLCVGETVSYSAVRATLLQCGTSGRLAVRHSRGPGGNAQSVTRDGHPPKHAARGLGGIIPCRLRRGPGPHTAVPCRTQACS